MAPPRREVPWPGYYVQEEIALGWQTDAAHERLKARVAANLVPPRIPFQPDQPMRALAICRLQCGERAFAIAEASVDGPDGVTGRVSSGLCERIELCQDVYGFFGLTAFAIEVAKGSHRRRPRP